MPLFSSLNIFGIALLWDWNENWPFLVLWPLLSFPNLLAYWVQHFNSISFRIWNRSAGILSPSLPLFIVMLPEAHLTSHSRMSISRRVITPSWLSGPWWSFLYSSPVYSCHLFLISGPGGSDSKESACNAGDLGLTPGSGRTPGEGNGNPGQYSFLKNPLDRGAWQARVHGVAKILLQWVTKVTS